MPIQVGDVVLVFDFGTRPPKEKFWTCVHVGRSWYFRLNTKPIWKPNSLVDPREDPWADDKSRFVQLHVIEGDPDYVQDAIDENGIKGTLSTAALSRLRQAVAAAKVLPTNQQKTILEAIDGEMARRRDS